MSTREQILPYGRILRYQFHERLTHWIAAFSYIYLLLTGLAFYSPWLFWLAILLGGGQVSRMLHPWAGLIFSAAVVYMYKMWAAQMRTTKTDKAWWRSLQFYGALHGFATAGRVDGFADGVLDLWRANGFRGGAAGIRQALPSCVV